MLYLKKANFEDAEKEYAMGDVEQEVYEDFLSKLDHEIDYEN